MRQIKFSSGHECPEGKQRCISTFSWTSVLVLCVWVVNTTSWLLYP